VDNATEGRLVATTEAGTHLRQRERRRIVGKLFFLVAGTLSFFLSVGLWFLGDDRETAIFVGLWVPSLFSLGALVAAPERSR
jgi:hypothetical protein